MLTEAGRIFYSDDDAEAKRSKLRKLASGKDAREASSARDYLRSMDLREEAAADGEEPEYPSL